MTTAISATDRYDRTTIGFHWLTAALVLVLFGSSLLWNYAPRSWGLRWLEGTHVSLGIALAAVLVARLIWRLVAGRKLETAVGGVAALASRAVHGLLYVLLAAQVALGFGLRWLQGETFSFFGLFSIPSLFDSNRELAHQFEQLHNLTAWAMIYLVAGHAAAALIHRYLLRDGVLQRMLPMAG
ncbi:MAG: cytochrome b [Devosia sp.]